MENPEQEVSTVIRLLTQSPPSIQHAAIQRFFTPDAEFVHPFCRTGTFIAWLMGQPNQRGLIEQIYRWYKIMSPKIEIDIDSVAFDEKNLKLYATINQVFSIWAVPCHEAHCTLVTVLDLRKEPPSETVNGEGKGKARYLIAKQEDLYQSSECAKFVSVTRLLYVTVLLWQYIATMVCVLCAIVGGPVTWIEEHVIGGRKDMGAREVVESELANLEGKLGEQVGVAKDWLEGEIADLRKSLQ